MSFFQVEIVAVFLLLIPSNTAVDGLSEPSHLPITLSPAISEGMRRSH